MADRNSSPSKKLSLSLEIRNTVLGEGEFNAKSIAKAIAWGVCTLGIAPAIAIICDLLSDEIYQPSTGIINEMGIQTQDEHGSSLEEHERNRLRRLPLEELTVIKNCLQWLDTIDIDTIGWNHNNYGEFKLFCQETNQPIVMKIDSSKVTLKNKDSKGHTTIMSLADYLSARLKKDATLLQDKNLSRADLCDMDLSNANLMGTNMAHANLSGVNLKGANLQGANLSYANLNGVDLDGVDLQGASLEGVDLSKVKNLDKIVNFSKLTLNKVKLSRETLEIVLKHNSKYPENKVSLRGVDLSGADLSSLRLVNADMREADLSCTNLNNTTLSNINLQKANLRGAQLFGTYLINNTNLNFANLTQANLNEVLMQSVSLENASMNGASLDGARFDVHGLETVRGLKTLSWKEVEPSQIALETLLEINKKARDSGKRLISLHKMNLKNRDLSHRDLSNMDLSNTALTGANLKGTNLQNTNLSYANLNGVDLDGVDLQGASLEGVDLSTVKNLEKIVNFSKLNLNKVKLSRETLEMVLKHNSKYPGNKVSLRGVNLSCVDLRSLNLDNTDMMEANLSCANLNNKVLLNTNLQKANLKGAQLYGTYLINTNLNYANLTQANLAEADLRSVSLKNASMNGANLDSARVDVHGLDTVIGLETLSWKDVKPSRTTLEALLEINKKAGESGKRLIILHKVDLKGVDLSHMDLSNTDLTEANLEGANLQYTVLENAKLINIHLLGAKINAATVLTNASISLAIDYAHQQGSINGWNINTLDRNLNHITNNETGSLLTVIDRISDRHNDIIISLIHTIIDSLKGVDISSVIDALIDIFINNPIYYQDNKIALFIKDRLLIKHITAANVAKLEFSGESRLRVYLGIIESQAETEQREFMLHNNGFFIQLMMQCTEIYINPEIIGKAQQLYQIYLELPDLRTAKRYLEDVCCADPLLVDTPEMGAGSCFAFFKAESDETNHLILLERQQIKRLLTGDLDAARNIYYLKGSSGAEKDVRDTDEARSLEHLVRHIILFKDAFQSQLATNKFNKLINLIDFCGLRQAIPNLERPEETMPGETYQSIFLKALNKARSDSKLTNDSDQVALMDIFAPLFKPDDGKARSAVDKKIEMTDIHRNQIMAAYSLNKATPQEQAQTFFSLGTAFIMFSSTKKFGEEGNSPEILRYYGLAFITEAYKLDPGVFGFTTELQQANFNDFQSRIRGLGDAFTCTSVLAGVMRDHARQNGFINLMNSLFPPVWISILQ